LSLYQYARLFNVCKLRLENGCKQHEKLRNGQSTKNHHVFTIFKQQISFDENLKGGKFEQSFTLFLWKRVCCFILNQRKTTFTQSTFKKCSILQVPNQAVKAISIASTRV